MQSAAAVYTDKCCREEERSGCSFFFVDMACGRDLTMALSLAFFASAELAIPTVRHPSGRRSPLRKAQTITLS